MIKLFRAFEYARPMDNEFLTLLYLLEHPGELLDID